MLRALTQPQVHRVRVPTTTLAGYIAQAVHRVAGVVQAVPTTLQAGVVQAAAQEVTAHHVAAAVEAVPLPPPAQAVLAPQVDLVVQAAQPQLLGGNCENSIEEGSLLLLINNFNNNKSQPL